MKPECYICKKRSAARHPRNRNLCPECGELNNSRRDRTCDLRGYTCVVTGGRIKVGFESALKLLRAGARVLVTSRFTDEAKARFSEVSDAGSWSDRLNLYSCDFRELGGVTALIEAIKHDAPTIDILINNAAQTIHRPPAFYGELTSKRLSAPQVNPLGTSEMGSLLALSSSPRPQLAERLDPDRVAELSLIPLVPADELEGAEFFPSGERDQHGQPHDRRSFNSWMMGLSDVALPELLEVLYINAVAPFMLCTELHERMKKKKGERPSFIVNVSAMEGNFYDPEKNWRHPHTNMAKAALNMMTRTAALDYCSDGIFMNSVDPGWITNERPHPLDAPPNTRQDRMPLDEIDGAARVCDPVFRALSEGDFVCGKLLKNFGIYPW